MIIKTYYELLQNDHSYFDLLQSSINSNKKFVYIQKNIPKIYVDMSKNFFKFLQKIVVNINGDKQSILKIIGDLNTTINIYERLWLLNKLNKML